MLDSEVFRDWGTQRGNEIQKQELRIVFLEEIFVLLVSSSLFGMFWKKITGLTNNIKNGYIKIEYITGWSVSFHNTRIPWIKAVLLEDQKSSKTVEKLKYKHIQMHRF